MVTSGISRVTRLLALISSLIFAGCAGGYDEDDDIITTSKEDDGVEAKGETTKEGDLKEENSASDPDEEGDLTAEEIPEEEELTPEEKELSSEGECDFNDCEEEGEPLVVDQPSEQSEPVIDSWTPNNNGPAPTPVRQADLRIDCTQLGAGLEPGYLRFGCKAFRQNGRHYGIVKGWWSINRNDGNRAKSKSLNFREAGFDMTFDVLASDAAAGISVAPGSPPPSI